MRDLVAESSMTALFPSLDAIHIALFPDLEPDLFARRVGRDHELPDSIEHGTELFIIAVFEFIQPPSQIRVSGQQRAQPYESALNRAPGRLARTF